MKSWLRVLGSEFNTECSKMEVEVERPPFEEDLRKVIGTTKQVIKSHTKVRSWEFLWWNDYKEESYVDYHIIHYLKHGQPLSYTERYPGTVVDPSKLEALYQKSLKLVRQFISESAVW